MTWEIREGKCLELNPEYAEMSRNRIRDDAPLLNTGLGAA